MAPESKGVIGRGHPMFVFNFREGARLRDRLAGPDNFPETALFKKRQRTGIAKFGATGYGAEGIDSDIGFNVQRK